MIGTRNTNTAECNGFNHLCTEIFGCSDEQREQAIYKLTVCRNVTLSELIDFCNKTLFRKVLKAFGEFHL